MASEVESNADSVTDEHEATCTCGHDELSEEVKQILEVRELYWDNPADFQHDQVPFLGFEVDSKLRPVIENLWIMGLPTDFSCEGYIELTHPELPSADFYAQIVFLRVRDAVRFYALITELFGAGTMFGPEGFTLSAMEGDTDDLFAAGYQHRPDFLSLVHARARAEVRFHPSYLEHFTMVLDDITSVGELDAKRSQLEIAEDLDEAYHEILDVSPEFRELAERGCDCGHEH